MNQFAEQGLIADLSDVWPIEGVEDSFKQASTASDGKQYFVPREYYPWAVFYKKSVFEKKGYVPPTTLDELNALTKKMQADDITPFAFADKDGWPAMGTFDILNMRINGFDFHMSLMAGDEEWDSTEVKQVFETWGSLLPVHQADPLGRTWQEAATSMSKGECGMYMLGTFVVDAIPDDEDDLDFFTFPELDSSIGSTAIDAPIDGWCLSANAKNAEGGKEMLKWLGTAAAADAANKGTTPAHLVQLGCGHQRLLRAAEEVGRGGRGGGEHRPVPRPRHPRRLRLDRHDPVDPEVPRGPDRHRRHHQEHPGAEGVHLHLRMTPARSARGRQPEG